MNILRTAQAFALILLALGLLLVSQGCQKGDPATNTLGGVVGK